MFHVPREAQRLQLVSIQDRAFVFSSDHQVLEVHEDRSDIEAFLHLWLHDRMATQLCPCGYYGDNTKPCVCSPTEVNKYLMKISGPMLDRIDIHIEVPRLKDQELVNQASGESSDQIRTRVERARETERKRFAGSNVYCNAHMNSKQIRKFCDPNDDIKELLKAAINQLDLSARAYDRILKLARTIADLEGVENITLPHVAEAVQYRSLDRKLWG